MHAKRVGIETDRQRDIDTERDIDTQTDRQNKNIDNSGQMYFGNKEDVIHFSIHEWCHAMRKIDKCSDAC